MVGQFGADLGEIVGSIGRRIGLGAGRLGLGLGLGLGPDSSSAPLPATGSASVSASADALYLDGALWNVRFPRLALGALVGGALGLGGALMQGAFGNPLAEPGVIGVSGGSAVGAAAAIVAGWDFAGATTVPLLALTAGVTTAVLVSLLSRSGARTEVLSLVLTGIAVNAIASALIAFLVFIGDTASREQIVFWQLGSLSGADWAAVGAVLPFIVVGTTGALVSARRLDLLALGERSAGHLGVSTERLRLLCVLCVAILTAAAVAYAGIIAFVGLIVPHLLRLALGPEHRTLLPASALGGALLVSGADIAARTVVSFADLPIGMFTACVGAPVFFVLLRRSLRGAAA
ncbi:FecCD family ABC transporter permease [Gryllotalpicola reticulitermitis]|uniref:FecCD family ABC transporter permease n=1 Tax=Gryllotalpicola reticulitermitis TaxID=1184153 RepID=A0ABV8Q9G5_9MICO